MSTNKPALRFEVLIVLLATMMVACSKLPLPGLGGGTSVVGVGTQAGKENNQTVGAVNNIDPQAVEQINVYNTDTVMLLILLIVAIVGTIGWLAPTPRRMWQKWTNK